MRWSAVSLFAHSYVICALWQGPSTFDVLSLFVARWPTVRLFVHCRGGFYKLQG